MARYISGRIAIAAALAAALAQGPASSTTVSAGDVRPKDQKAFSKNPGKGKARNTFNDPHAYKKDKNRSRFRR